MARRPAIDRLMDKVVESPDGCWLFTGSRNAKGYGSIWTGDKLAPAYRVAYECFRAEIPPGLCLDHLCRTPACVNPWHLEPVTNVENKRRSRGFLELQRPTCRAGHPYDEANTYRSPDGSRACRACRRITCAAYKRRRKERAA